ncbi:hypothetical protein AOL_s00004g149 [Orbilia oligospora ATCC 24927]|uniref:Uncharacterized protein n=2 Tax=Orbilia oligospora TaxID=2813651 RepID=G1WXY9_ARTOA|nr:hypothetical protein AOL_s00004g149 [Orbilia oligospora ATCC 24927]EGX54116.1 hypothetical protein AOL_s00004g149 [Orbilia oligospora ATCC 24927]KAF3286136.1 Translation initiation factor 3 subunit b [Orbilia oligospora]
MSKSSDETEDTSDDAQPLCFFVPSKLFIDLKQSSQTRETTKTVAARVLDQMDDAAKKNKSQGLWNIPAREDYDPDNSECRKPFRILIQAIQTGLLGDLADPANNFQKSFYSREEGEEPWSIREPLTGDFEDVAIAKSYHDAVDKCYDNLGIAHEFFLKCFNHNSIDDKGAPLIAVVHYGFSFPCAFYAPSGFDEWQYAFCFGDGWDQLSDMDSESKFFGNFAGSLECVAHEMMHAITHYLVNLEYSGESGALNEHISDTFGMMAEQWHKGHTVKQSDWLIGEDILLPEIRSYVGIDGVTDPEKSYAMKSMKAPGTAYNIKGLGGDNQVCYMKDYKYDLPIDKNHDWGGVHINSGIPNHAFYQFANFLGGNSWDLAGKIWFESLKSEEMYSKCRFLDWARITIKTAKSYKSLTPLSLDENGKENTVASLLRTAWKIVGINTPISILND